MEGSTETGSASGGAGLGGNTGAAGGVATGGGASIGATGATGFFHGCPPAGATCGGAAARVLGMLERSGSPRSASNVAAAGGGGLDDVADGQGADGPGELMAVLPKTSSSGGGGTSICPEISPDAWRVVSDADSSVTVKRR